MPKQKRNRTFRRPRVQRIPMEQIHVPGPGDMFYVPRNDQHVQLIKRGLNGEAQMIEATVPLAEVEADDPSTLERVKAHLRESPAIWENAARDLLHGQPRLLVFRNAAGKLVQFDDYVKFAVAQDLGLPRIHVLILGE